MTRKQKIIVASIGLFVFLVLTGFIVVSRNKRLRDGIPAWLRYRQPPDTVAADMLTLTADESWAANRCRPMAASCLDNTAARRVRRTYPGSLEQSPTSFIRGHAELSGGL